MTYAVFKQLIEKKPAALDLDEIWVEIRKIRI
jgi:hypothetical protein